MLGEKPAGRGKPVWENRRHAFSRHSARVDEAYISALVLRFMQAIVGRYRPERDVLHIMGEMCFSFALVNELRKAGFTCVASTSERKVREENGYKRKPISVSSASGNMSETLILKS